jgi:hypothetical protein
MTNQMTATSASCADEMAAAHNTIRIRRIGINTSQEPVVCGCVVRRRRAAYCQLQYGAPAGNAIDVCDLLWRQRSGISSVGAARRSPACRVAAGPA